MDIKWVFANTQIVNTLGCCFFLLQCCYSYTLCIEWWEKDDGGMGSDSGDGNLFWCWCFYHPAHIAVSRYRHCRMVAIVVVTVAFLFGQNKTGSGQPRRQ